MLWGEKRAQLSRGRPAWETERASYEDLRHLLRRAIKRSKKLFFQRICQEVDVNPFGTAYKVICKRIGARGQLKQGCPVFLREINCTLSPRGQPYTFISKEPEAAHIIPEVFAACTGIGDRNPE